MGLEPVLNAILLACSLVFGQLISTSHHVTTKSADGVVATLNWTGELRWQVPDDGGRRFKATLLGPSSLRISGRGLAPEVFPLAPFWSADHAFIPVGGPADGCGASTNLTIIPKRDSPLPYVVAFAVLAEKGCMPIPVVFVPLRTASGNYHYVGAPYIAMWSSEPKASARVRVALLDRIMLPRASIAGMSGEWPVVIAVNNLASGPRAITAEPPNNPKHIRVGSTISLGSFYNAWFDPETAAHHS